MPINVTLVSLEKRSVIFMVVGALLRWECKHMFTLAGGRYVRVTGGTACG